MSGRGSTRDSRLLRYLAVLVLALILLTLVLALTRHEDPAVQQQVPPIGLGTPVVADAPARELTLLHRASRTRPLVSSTPTSSPTPVHTDARPSPRATRSHRPFVAKAVSSDFAHSRRGIAIANCESGPGPRHPKYDVYVGDPHATSGKYRGKWMFAYSTWRSVGGSGDPADASVAEQDYRANLLYAREHERPWECRLYV